MQVVFYRGDSPGAALVRWFTRSPWGHCAVVQGSRVVEATVAGVQQRPWGTWEDKAARCVVVPGTTPDGEYRAGQFLLQEVGRGYDWAGIVLDVFAKFVHLPRFITDETRKQWTCSRLAAFATAEAGWQGPAWPVPATPGGLYDALTKGQTK